MAVRGLDHVNIRTPAVAETARFFVDVLGFTAATLSRELDASRAAWLADASGRAVVHVNAGDEAGGGTGALHHVAFDCTDHPAMIERLTRLCIAHRLNEVPSIGLRQIFVAEPNGVLLELNFRGGTP